MPPEIAPAPSQTAADPKQAAANIAKGVQDKAGGRSTAQTAAGTAAIDRDNRAQADKAAASAAAAAVPADPNAGKKKYVVNGQERWLTPEQADAYVQKGLAFEPKVSELDRMKREFEQLEQTMLTDPGRILSNLAARAKVPVKDIVERVLNGTASDEVKEATGKWYWENVAKRARMDPKDLQLLEQEETIQKMKAAEEAKREAAIAAENKAKVAQAMAQVSAQIQETLKELGIKNTDSPAAVRITREIADVMRLGYLSQKPVTAKQAAEKVKARIMEYQREFYDTLDMDQLVGQLGKENAEKVRKYFLKVVQEQEKGTRQETQRPAAIPKRNQRQTIGLDEFHEYLDEVKRTGSTGANSK